MIGEGYDYIRAFCLSGTLNYTKYFFKARFGRRFIVNEHHEKICHALDDVIDGKIKKLIINIAPRYSKTELAVKNFISYGLAINPSSKFIHLSFSDDLANDNSDEIREIVKHEEYRKLFPYVAIKRSSDAKKKWYTTEGGGVYATAAGGQVTGFGAGAVEEEELLNEINSIPNKQNFSGALIIDDPIKPEDALSDTAREKVNQRFETTIRNRVNSRNTPIIIIMQRLHEHDLCGYLQEIEPGEWNVLSLPVINYKNGKEKALWEFKHTLNELYKIKKSSDFVFETQYMQNPTPMEGLMYGNFKTYETIPFTNRAIRKNYTDTADTGNDYLCSIDYVDTEIGNFILDVLYTQKSMEFTETETAKMMTKDQISKTNIESNNGGRGFARNVERQMRIMGNDKTQINSFHQSNNKNVRIFTRASEVMNLTYFPIGWERMWSEFASHIKSYRKKGKNMHDDAEDALTGTIEMRGEVDVKYYNRKDIIIDDELPLYTEIHPNLNGLFIIISYFIYEKDIYLHKCTYSESIIQIDSLPEIEGKVDMEIPCEMKFYANDFRLNKKNKLWVREERSDKISMIESYKHIIKEIYFPESDETFTKFITNVSDYDGINSYESMYILSCITEKVKSLRLI